MAYINLDEWKNGEPGDTLIDAGGFVWTIIENLAQQKSHLGYALEVVCEGHQSEILYMRELMDGHPYIFAYDGLLVELNQPSSRLIKNILAQLLQ